MRSSSEVIVLPISICSMQYNSIVPQSILHAAMTLKSCTIHNFLLLSKLILQVTSLILHYFFREKRWSENFGCRLFVKYGPFLSGVVLEGLTNTEIGYLFAWMCTLLLSTYISSACGELSIHC